MTDHVHPSPSRGVNHDQNHAKQIGSRQGAVAVRRLNYLERASRRFVERTRCRTPIEAVIAGKHTLETWAQILGEEREREQLAPILKHRKRKRRNS